MALLSLSTYYSFPNIKQTNNAIRISIDDGVSWSLLIIPVGCYELSAINVELQRLIVQIGGKANQVMIQPNVNTLHSILLIENVKYHVDFTIANSLRTVLGFESKTYTRGRYESVDMVNINSVNSIFVHCDAIQGSHVDGKLMPVIHTFFPNVAPGEKIVHSPHNLTYIPIMSAVIPHMTVWLTDQHGEALDLRGEKVTITFTIKPC
jgi:hypothetical protein